MKICIPSEGGACLAARISPHFGWAPSFVVVDTESGESSEVPNAGEGRDEGCCAPLEVLTTLDIDAVVCRSMGRHSLARLESEGIGVFVSKQPRLWQALAEVWGGIVDRLSRDEACAGRHEHGGET